MIATGLGNKPAHAETQDPSPLAAGADHPLPPSPRDCLSLDHQVYFSAGPGRRTGSLRDPGPFRAKDPARTPKRQGGDFGAADGGGDRLTPMGADTQPLDQLENVDSVFVISADSPALLVCHHARASQFSCLFFPQHLSDSREARVVVRENGFQQSSSVCGRDKRVVSCSELIPVAQLKSAP